MGVDVINGLGIKAGAAQRIFHRGPQAFAIGMRDSDVVAVGGLPPAGHLAVDLGSAPLNLLLALEHHDGCAARAHKPVAPEVERPRGEVRVHLQGERPHAGKRQDALDIAVLRADHKHALLPVERDLVVGEPDRV